MIILLCVFILVIVVLLFLYISLKRDVKSLLHQIQYTNHEESKFNLYTTSLDADMKVLAHLVDEVRVYYENDRNRYMDMDQNFKKMITNISHDIRTPLTSISGYLQMLEECSDEEERLRYHSVIRSRINYLKELLEALFLYTKISNDSFELHPERICVFDKVCENLMPFHQQMKEKGIDIVVAFDQERVGICIDVICFERIISNILNNVLKHGSKQLQVKGSCENKQFIVSFANEVVDTNIQINALFERFYTADHSRSKQNSGLGLAIVKELVEKNKGSVTASLEDMHLRIEVSFPIAE